MSRQQVLLLEITAILVMSFLVGCGGSAPTPVSEAPAATSVPEQAAATPTPEPPPATPTPEPPTPTPEPPTDTPTPEPPTATPTPEPPTATSPPAIINPQPGITLTGNLKNSEGQDSGTINFMVSEDGKSITLVDVIVKYEGASVLLGFVPFQKARLTLPFPTTASYR